jgi:hypothetical protein
VAEMTRLAELTLMLTMHLFVETEVEVEVVAMESLVSIGLLAISILQSITSMHLRHESTKDVDEV